MKNYQVKGVDGNLYWVHRSVAAAGFVFNIINGFTHILAVKRGVGAADGQGLWCCPCGYLDFDETLEECVIREIKEETGLIIPKNELSLIQIHDDPIEEKQNVTAQYFGLFIDNTEELFFSGEEIDEVEEIKWIPMSDLESYEWAFNHFNTIVILADKLLHFFEKFEDE